MSLKSILPYLLGGIGGGYLYKHRKDLFGGKQPEAEKLSTLSGTQNKMLKNILSNYRRGDYRLENQPLYQQGSEYLSNLLSDTPEAYEKFKAPMMTEFNEQIVPGIAERFAGMGAGSQSSSAFGQQMGAAGANLSERLGAMRSGLQMQGMQQALPYAQAPGSEAFKWSSLALGTKPFGYNIQGAQPGFGSQLAGGIGQALPALLMSLFA